MEKNRPGNPTCTAPCLEIPWNIMVKSWLVGPLGWWESHFLQPCFSHHSPDGKKTWVFFGIRNSPEKSSAPSDVTSAQVEFGRLRRQGARNKKRNPQWPKDCENEKTASSGDVNPSGHVVHDHGARISPRYVCVYIYRLVVLTILKNDGVRHLGWWHSQLNGKIINVWNRQPVYMYELSTTF